MTNLVHVMDRLFGQPLFILPQKAEVIAGVVLSRSGLDLPSFAEVAGATGIDLVPEASRFVGTRRRESGGVSLARATGGVAVIDIVGSLVNRGAWLGASSGLVSYEGIAAQIDAALAESEIRAIVLDINSPGGEATGMFGLAEKIRAARAVKPVVAVVNDVAASAAYGIASSADEIVISPTSIVGSIGVVFMHVDRSGEKAKAGIVETAIYAGANKTVGLGPLTAEARATFQSMVDAFYERFLDTVAAGRGDRTSSVAARATEASIFVGEAAITAGLADRLGSFDQVLSELSNRPAARRANIGNPAMSNAPTTPVAADPVATVPEAQAAARVDAARTEGAAAERARCEAILSCADAKGRETMAAHLAFRTAMPAAEAVALLAVSPKAEAPKSGSRLDAAVPDPQVPAGGAPISTAESADLGLGAAVDRMIAGMPH